MEAIQNFTPTPGARAEFIREMRAASTVVSSTSWHPDETVRTVIKSGPTKCVLSGIEGGTSHLEYPKASDIQQIGPREFVMIYQGNPRFWLRYRFGDDES